MNYIRHTYDVSQDSQYAICLHMCLNLNLKRGYARISQIDVSVSYLFAGFVYNSQDLKFGWGMNCWFKS